MKNDLLDQAIRIKREQGSKSILAFAKLFLPHYLGYKTSKAHRDIYNTLYAITNKRGRKVVIAAPRGFGKSTLITLIYVLYCICYEKERFIVLVSHTASQVTQILANIKKELMDNDELVRAFPEICKTSALSRLAHWHKESIVTGNKIQVLALGSGQKIRGRRSGADRPTLIIADDLENADNTFSSESREKLKDIFEKSILMAGSEKTNFIFIGNLYHPHCLLGDYMSESKGNQWIQMRYAAIEQMPDRMDLWGHWSDIYNSKQGYGDVFGPEGAVKYYMASKAEMDRGAVLLWPERHTLYELMCMREQNGYSFLSEMQNMPLDPSRITFNTDEFHYWDENGRSLDDLLRSFGNDVEFYGACDPSLGESVNKGDFSAIIVLARVKGASKTFFVIVADIKRRPVDEIVGDILAYATRYNFVKFGIEANNFQKVLVGLVEEKARNLGIRIRVEPITSRGNKIARIKGMKVWTKGGSLQFSKRHRQLLEECRYFPKGNFDDGLDALEMAVALALSSNEVDRKTVKTAMEACRGGGPSSNPNDYFIQDGVVIPNPYGLLKAK
ncbi:MAG: phage terminase large subunit [Sedimentisphaerales bacterium]|jgi:predicted phage terminase large subunit-like protein